MDKDLGKFCGTTSPNLSPDALAKVDDTRPDSETPAHVSQAVLGSVEGESADVLGTSRVANEATGGVGVETNHEEEGEVVGVPESFEALSADLRVSGRVPDAVRLVGLSRKRKKRIHKHEEHDEKHRMAGDTTRLCVVDIQSTKWTNLAALNVDEVHVMGGGVKHGPESHGVGNLSMAVGL